MLRQNYQNKRDELVKSAEALLAAGDVEAAQAVREEIEKLDAGFEAAAKEAANLAALKDKTEIMDFAAKSVAVPGAQVIDSTVTAAVDEKKIYENAFAKHLMGKKMDMQEATIFESVNVKFSNAAHQEGDNKVIVPETVREKIWTEIKDAHPILGDMAMTFVPGDLTIIKETTGIGEAGWVDESDLATDSTLGFGTLTLSGCELTKAITVSWKLKKMSMSDFLVYVATEIAYKMGAALAFAVINGQGKPSGSDTFKAQPRGIITALNAEAETPQVVQYTTGGVPTYANLTVLMSKIKSGYFGDCVIYANNEDIWTKLANIVDTNKRPVFIADPISGGVGRLFGRVVKEEAAVPVGCFLIGSVSRGYVFNVNENVSMHYEDHVKPRTTDYMGWAIVDGDVLTTKAFALLAEAPETP